MRVVLVLVLLLAAASASAQVPARLARGRARAPMEPPGVAVSVRPLDPSAPARRYLYVLELQATSWGRAELVADRRLLSFEVQGPTDRRPLRCSAGDAPRFRDPPARLYTLDARDEPYREWIDLRMYCWGRALDALDRGAHVTATYGFARASRGAWVARPVGDPTRAVASIELPAFEVAARAQPEVQAPLEVRLQPADRATAQGLTLRVAVLGAQGESRRVYFRPDLVRLRVRGPLGDVHCSIPRPTISPIVDFFARLGRGRGPSASLIAEQFCPRGFQIPGIYEVTPMVDLIYDGARFHLDTVTGTFEGRAVPVRVRGGGAYVEQTLDTAPFGDTE